mmetsp:Transcript_111934/g.241363  ORF Transcript_111934/g.241363 Transcript_111934/m.241363 type:complete len:208 (+) Transcript_111934:1793-2416(+)
MKLENNEDHSLDNANELSGILTKKVPHTHNHCASCDRPVKVFSNSEYIDWNRMHPTVSPNLSNLNNKNNNSRSQIEGDFTNFSEVEMDRLILNKNENAKNEHNSNIISNKNERVIFQSSKDDKFQLKIKKKTKFIHNSNRSRMSVHESADLDEDKRLPVIRSRNLNLNSSFNANSFGKSNVIGLGNGNQTERNTLLKKFKYEEKKDD